MGDIAIRAEGLSKQYRIGARAATYRTLREALTQAFLSSFRSKQPRSNHRSASFPALNDVSFEIKRGEVVGLIGPNGAGKSTLLKILARITPPSAGRAEVHGRLGSLLEVGTGFHSELTGRENLYLSSAILGMSRTEAHLRFDEIVEFAEIADFIDVPVKHYSTGMYMRLAFAVAAHLDTDILLVDEVLAVGDTRFQRKCLAKMQTVSEHGRTVIFVSHELSAITRLCERALLLDHGTLIEDGPAAHVVTTYLRQGAGTTAVHEWPDPRQAPSGDVSRLCAVRVRDGNGDISIAVDIRQPVSVELEYEVRKPGYVLIPHFKFTNQDGVDVFAVFDWSADWRRRPRPCGRYISTVTIPDNFLAEGTLFVTVGLFAHEPYIKQFYEKDVVSFNVVDTLDGDSARGEVGSHIPGVVRPLLPWNTDFRPC
jgi:homopolymeric O-antigen transport system ATP-binding protein